MSNSEDLDEILAGDDVDAVLQYFHGRDEKQRQSVAAACLAAYKQRKDAQHLHAAVLAACSLTDLKKLGRQARPVKEISVRVLSDRRPPWADEYVRAVLLEVEYYWAWWPLVRQLVLEGVCSKPDHPHYILGMVSGLAHRRHGEEKAPITQRLLADRKLLQDEVWRIFEHEGGGESSLANYDRFSRDDTWTGALIQLSRDGHLDRDRLIDSSLDALGRDFNQYRAKWFAEFHDALQLNQEELAARAPRYVHLLASNTEPTAAWAFAIVEALDAKTPFDANELLENLRPILRSRKKGLVKSAIKLIDRVVKRCSDREICTIATGVVAEALLHEAADVQNAALERIETLGNPLDEGIEARLRELRDLVAPSCRVRLDALLRTPSQETVEAPATGAAAQPRTQPSREAVCTTELADRLKNVDANMIRLAGLSGFVSESTAAADKLAAAIFDGTDIPRLDPDHALSPIEDIDELIDTAARCIEEPTLIDDAERALDGMSRLCAERPANFDSRVAPLLHRVTKLLKTKMFAFAGFGPDDDVCGTVYAWATGELLEPANKRGYQNPLNEGMYTDVKQMHRSLMGFFSRRSLHLARRVAAQVARPMLSAPTHRGSWVDARVLVQRARQWVNSSSTPDAEDLILALLRLAPDHRALALNEIPDSDAEWILALRYALGESPVTIGENAGLWIAAARSRAPWQDDQAVESRHAELGPDAGRAARYQWQEYMDSGKWPSYRITVEPKFPKSIDGQLASVLFHEKFEPFGEPEGAARVCWLTTAWPQARESLFARGALQIGSNIDWVEAHWANKRYLEPLLDADVPILPMAALLLGIALSAKEPGEHQLAIDITAGAIDDGRLDGEALGKILRDLLSTKSIKAARWAKTLAEVARVSQLHGYVVRKAIEASLRTAPDPPPRDLHALLELELELCIEARDSIRDEQCRKVLGGFTGSNKLAKAAKKLLELVPDESQLPQQCNEACDRACAQRLHRLEAWLKRC